MSEKNQNILDTILDLKARDPFVPFRIVPTSGDKYRIVSAENLVELKTEFFYATPGGESFVFFRKKQDCCLGVSRRTKAIAAAKSLLSRTAVVRTWK